ncbi:o-succinylbenzoate synthase [Bergeyella cardium]|uniref:O-succinylbenzoate synthase n=1 Tax=Bergeyella cardium TaxID=1585976 RepID=A0A6P1QWG6_9FLAO|nr:o-succinylbenzoate synthase [Bergeyella cardium]QHN65477.1 o-succinylbenzoate synthase [Bergeyella cardium]WHE33058.1 o-succinylbenzoate synthase [Bergeyella cardium]WHF59708.1 o-succinylbenzoate synthase [Bergeyella cardium]
MKARFSKYILNFKRPAGTSRGILTQKETYILEISDGDKKGIGECALFRGLSYDDTPDYEEKLNWLCQNINQDRESLKHELLHYPSLWFGYEQAMNNLSLGADRYFENDFTKGVDSIKINGLIWMGSVDFMKEQIQEKLSQNFDCIKLKIGVDWEQEKAVLSELRKAYPKEVLELRVDANGAFTPQQATEVLNALHSLGIHSIEQPIKAGNWEQMRQLCQQTPTSIALDEELIGIIDLDKKIQLLDTISPQYIILKPSLVGGFSGTDEWISLAEERNIGWWITSALESNIGLNAIAQYTYSKYPKIPQGLGTGSLFTNNFPTPLILKGDKLRFKR